MQKIRKLSSGKFIRNVAIVASGTAAAQAIGVIFTPIITRIYGPEAFGLMGTFLSLGAVAASASALAYPFAIVLPVNDSDAKKIARLSVFISIIMSSIAALIIYIYGDRLFALIGAQAITAFALLIPLKMLFAAWLRVVQQWLIRKKQFKITAKVEVIQALILNSSKTVIGYFNPVAAVLIILSTIGVGLHVLMLSLNIRTANRNTPKHKNDSKATVRKHFKIARKYYDFPLYRAPTILLDTTATNLPIIMLAALFGPIAAGFYVLGNKLLKAPTKLIGRSISNVFYPKITKAAQTGKDLRILIINATVGLAAVGLIPFGAVGMFGPSIFKFVFGPEWIMAGEYARWISLFVFFNFIARPTFVATATLGLQKEFLVYEIISIAFKVAALYAGYKIYASDLVSIAFFSVSGIIPLLVLMTWVIAFAGRFTGRQRFENS